MGQTVGLRIQLKVAQRLRTMHRRHRFGMRRRLLLEHPVHGQRLRVVTRGGVEVVQQALTLVRRQQRHLLQYRVIIADHGRQ